MTIIGLVHIFCVVLCGAGELIQRCVTRTVDQSPVLASHGTRGDARAPLAPAQNDCQIILIDAREHGVSDTPHDPEAYTLQQLVGDTVAVLDHLHIATADFKGLTHQALGLHLMTNAVIVWHTVYRAAVVEQFKQAGYPAQKQDVAHGWPTCYAHINIYRKYRVHIEEEGKRYGLQPLRQLGVATPERKNFFIIAGNPRRIFPSHHTSTSLFPGTVSEKKIVDSRKGLRIIDP